MPIRGPITHVVFDMDGVLLDTEPLYTRATQQVLAEFGRQYDWSLKANMMGRNAIEAARYLVTALALPVTAEDLLARSQPILERLCEEVQEIPGAQSFVRSLHERRIPMAVATSTGAALFRLKTKRHRWFELFSTVVCGDHPGVLVPKPAPDIFLVAAQALSAAPQRCLVVEDSPAGVTAALAAGMQVIALPDRALPATLFAEAHHLVRAYAELSVADLGLV